MQSIYKYELALMDEQEVEMPIGAEILTVQYQGENLFLWAKVDIDAFRELRTFRIVGTGQWIDKPLGAYIATVQDGPFVWHIFEAPR